MKRILIIIFLFSCVISQAQPYQSMFGHARTEWKVLLNGLCGLNNSMMTHRTDKDTLIDNKIYKKVISPFYQHTAHQGDVTYFLREDTDSGKVWIRNMTKFGISCYRDETLLCDFSLNKGDTFPRAFDSDGIWYLKIDSVYYEDGRKHLVMNYEMPFGFDETLEMVEGIGYTFGLDFTSLCGACVFDHYMLCVYKDGTKAFGNRQFNGDCYPYGFPTIIDEIATDGFTIAPNPAFNTILVNLVESIEKKVPFCIRNIYGQQVKQGLITPQKQEQISIEELPTGVYSISINNKISTFTKQ